MSKDKYIGSIILEAASKMEDVIVGDDIKNGVKRRVIAEGTLQDLDVQNRNKRYYAKADIEKELKGPRWQELLRTKTALSELSHPLSDSLIRQQTIDAKFACARFLKTWIDGNRVKAQFKGTNNDYGETFDLDLREGVKPAFSLRALGNIENENGKAYVKNVKIITFDEVCYPSHAAAYTEKIISENAIEYEKETGKKMYATEAANLINEMNDCGRVIHIGGKEALDTLNRLQRESASIGAILETFEGIADEVKVVDNKIRLRTAFGETMYLPLDKYVSNLITNYVYSL